MSDSNENPAYSICIYNKISREEEELPGLKLSYHADGKYRAEIFAVVK
jgi:hypothetical protein